MAPTFRGVKIVLLDIEGTVCPISFVKETLFPYAVNALPEVLSQKWDDPDFQSYRDAFPENARASPAALETHVKDLTARDVKFAPLKNLQGYLWQAGYENKAYSTPLFPDVTPQLQQWKDASLEIAIYSSGSIFAQKLLFAHVKDPASQDPKATHDLSHLITDWYDTTNAGPKVEASSYTKIVEALNQPANSILFLSDNVKEVQAALEAGMKSVVVDRPGNAPLTEEDQKSFTVVASLEEISIAQLENADWSRKRKADESSVAGSGNEAESRPTNGQASNNQSVEADSSMKKAKAEDMGTAPSTKNSSAEGWCMSQSNH